MTTRNPSTVLSVRTRRPRRIAIIAAVAGTALAVAAPSVASAHVGVSPDEIAAGDHGVLTFSFSHGCDGSPTTALRITMPDGLTSVAPTIDGDWTIDIERGDDALVSAVTFTALTPVPNDLRGAVSMSVGLDEDAPNALAFPVEQRCVDGVTEWTQIAEEGEDPHDLEAPAPVLTVVAGDADAHAGQEGHDGADAASDDADSDPDEAAAPGAISTALGAAGLVAGLSALVVAILAYRRRS